MPIKSQELFRLISSSFEEAERQIESAAEKKVGTRLTIWLGFGDPHLDLVVEVAYNDKTEVRGLDLQEMTDEAIRRMGWQQRQNTLQLGHVIDSTAEEVAQARVAKAEVLVGEVTPTASRVDDEIPF